MISYSEHIKIKGLLLCIVTAFLLWGCAQLDHAGDVVFREISSVNENNPQINPDMGALPEYGGEEVEAGNP